MINEWYQQDVNHVLNRLKANASNGLDEADVANRLIKYGPNELVERDRKKWWLILFQQFTSTLVLILFVAAIISGFLGKSLEMYAIMAIVVLFAILGFIQEYRAERAMAALKKLTVDYVRVLRNGEIKEIAAQKLVPGDIITLEAGDLVPADVRLIESHSLSTQEAALTGESAPVDKTIAAIDTSNLPLGDRTNMAYMGTTVTYGHGYAVVVETGMRSEIGKVATLIQEVEAEITPLQRRLNQVGKILAVLGGIVAVLIMLIGIFFGETLSTMFLTAVSVAVAVVPEGLPAVVTVTLALGAQRMLRRHALIRKLPAVETLGSVTVICSDKTGTLTENRMTVTVIDVAGRYVEFKDDVRHPAPILEETTCGQGIFFNQPATVCMVLAGGALCNDAVLKSSEQGISSQTVGDPTEGALLVAASRAGFLKSKLQAILPRVAEQPFDSDRKRMTTIHQLPDDPELLPERLKAFKSNSAPYLAITKGSVDGLLEISNQIWVDDHLEQIDQKWLQRIRVANDQLAQKGMRVLGIAIHWLDNVPAKVQANELEHDLIFIGLIGMIDPPRHEVEQAVQICKTAGIRPVMITGDHPLTARFIAHELGISQDGKIITGKELDQMDNIELQKAVKDVSIYARVSPQHKLAIVQALQERGEVVAMTGDGVNDSPALKKADIGIAMGITGTDVSKEAADMVLMDDNFSTIVAAVKEGRVIYDNILRFIRFSIAGNIGKVLVMLLTPLFGISVAMLPLQLLWLNLLTDGLLGLGLGFEPAEKNTMRRPPRAPQASIFSNGVGWQVIWIGAFIGAIALAIGYIYYNPQNPADKTWQTMIFTGIAFIQIGQALALRSVHRVKLNFGANLNPVLLILVITTIGLQLTVLYLPFFIKLFKITPLSAANLVVCMLLGGLTFIVIKVERLLFPSAAELHNCYGSQFY